MPKPNANCHQRIAALRLIAGLTATAVARRLGMKLHRYLAVERGEVAVDSGIADALCALYDIPPGSLCDGPLPVPRSFAPPLTVGEELAELLVALWELYERIDRYRQGLGGEWRNYKGYLEDMLASPIIVPYPRGVVLVPPDTEVSFWVDLPHEVFPGKRWNKPFVVSLNNKEVGRGLGPFTVGPGQVKLRHDLRGTMPIRIRPVIQ